MDETNKLYLKLVLIIFVGLFFVGLVSAEVETLGVFKQDECIELIQTCSNCTYSNLTSVMFPNGTIDTISELMTKNGNEYNFSYCNTTALGQYIVNGFSDVDGADTMWAYDLLVTYTGKELGTQTSILYIGLLAGIIIFMAFILYSIPKLPRHDIVSEQGLIIDINKLKYLRPVLYGIAWLLLISIMYLSSNIALAFLPHTMFGSFLFVIYRIMFILTLPMVIVWLIYLISKIYQDVQMKKLIERGIEFRGSFV